MTIPNLPGLDWHPTLPLVLIGLLAGLAALAAVVFILFTRTLRGWAKLPVLLLRLTTIAVLVVIALNPVSTDKAAESQRSAAILLDSSTSMALGTRMVDGAAFLQAGSKDFTAGPLNRFTYGAETKVMGATASQPTPNGRTTLLGSGIRRALDSQPPPASILVIGDGGGDDRRELDSAAQVAKARGIPIHVHPVGGNDPMANAWIGGIRVASGALQVQRRACTPLVSRCATRWRRNSAWMRR